MDFKDELRKRLLDNKLTQKEFSEQLSYNYQTVRRWATGTRIPNKQTIDIIRECLLTTEEAELKKIEHHTSIWESNKNNKRI